MLCDELQKTWLNNMLELLKDLGDNTILLWFSSRKPPKNAVRDPKDPQKDAAVLRASLMSADAIAQIMGPNAHRQAAQALQETCAQMMRQVP